MKYYYKKNSLNKKRNLKILSGIMFISGLIICAYIFFPLIFWQLFFAPAFANQEITAPIPKVSIVDTSFLESMVEQASQGISGIEYTNAQNWFPGYKSQSTNPVKIASYTISIPKLDITNATVSTQDYDLAKHLVNYQGTAVPPEKGNTVIFGHSTLPWLFSQKDYKTIFADAYKLNVGDEIIVNVQGVTYKYKIENITVVDPANTSVLEQNYTDSFLTLITCTPPGTIWKRLVIRSRLETN